METQRWAATGTRWRAVALTAAGYALLSIAMTWPLLPRLRTHVLQDLGDPLLQAWQLAWVGHALRDGGATVWDANTFWPLPDTLAFSDALLGYAPAGLVGTGLTAALVRYGLLVLFGCTLAGLGAHLLAQELGARPLAATLAGVAFAWAPWRLGHLGHLNVLSTGGIPLTFLLLVRGYRERRWGLVLAGWLVAAWQLSIGFAVGLFFAYVLLVVAGVTAVWWWRAGRPLLGVGVARATALGVVLLLGWTLVQATPYLRVRDAHPESQRTLAHVEVYSPPPSGLLAAPDGSVLWGERTAPLRRDFVWTPEQARFPGAVALLLGIAGAFVGTGPRRLRVGLAAGVGVTGLLALGTSTTVSRWLYAGLFTLAPGWDAIRTPGRLITFTSLGLGLLAALAADRFLRRGVGGAAGAGRVPGVVVTALVALAVAEGVGDVPVEEVPRPDPLVATLLDAPRLHLPSSDTQDQLFMAWTVADGLRPVVNGASGVQPVVLRELRAEVAGFPDDASVAALRALGVRQVVLHRELAAGTPWQDAADRPVAGLGLTRREVGDAVVFDLGP